MDEATSIDGHSELSGKRPYRRKDRPVEHQDTATAMNWKEIEALVKKHELEYAPKRVITRVFCECEAPELWYGIYANAHVHKGEPAFQLNTGEIISL